MSGNARTHRPTEPDAAWRAVRDLFYLAEPLAQAQREALLAAPGRDPGIVAEVRSLLGYASGLSASFLSAPALPLGAPAAQREGQRLGAWRISTRLGSGGMGEVWLADRADGAYTGQAAVKVLKQGMDSVAVLARFALEQQALARLSHPGIAHLIDAGRTDEGLPYFVMEHVPGRPIDQACRGLPLAARLALFLQLADAVAHAHRNLLLHRDLKPSNVLVTEQGQVKLLDFGIAKALEANGGEDATQQGPRPMTPQFASPEQLRGEPVGTATDVYSLGVLLYVMLTGQRPYGRDARSTNEATQAALNEEPTRPSRLPASDEFPALLRGALRGEIDNILLKALDKVAERRYPSVDALAADLRAHLGDYPVSARPASGWYLASKFALRNRLAVALALLAAVSLVGGLAATRWQMHQADMARRAAERRFADVRQMANQLVFRYHDQIINLPGAVAVRQALLDDAARYLDGLAAESEGDPTLQRELAETFYRLAVLQGDAFSPSQEQIRSAQRNAARATALLAHYVDDPKLELSALNTAVDMWILRGTIEARLGRIAANADALRQAAVIAESARRRAPDDLQVISRLATLQGRIALALGANLTQPSLGQVDEAGAHWDQAEKLFAQLVQREPERAEWVHQLAWSLIGQANWALLMGQFDLALVAASRAVELRDRAAAMKPDDAHFEHQRALARNNLAAALSFTGDHAAALERQDEAVAIIKRSIAVDPSNSAARRDGVLVGLVRARQLDGLGRRAQALAAARGALAALPAATADDYYMTRWRAEALVWVSRLQRDTNAAAAVAAAREAVALLQGLTGEDHAARRWARAAALEDLSLALLAVGQRSAAIEAAREALHHWGPKPPGFFTPAWRRAAALVNSATG